jgi:molecular chaperone DnaJ
VRTRDWATVDFYSVLGVAPTASTEEIGFAFRALAKQLHPDRTGAVPAEAERFKAVTAAYEVLGDDRLRRSYDEVRIAVAPIARPEPATGVTPPAPRAAGARSVPPEIVRRNARRWLAGGIAVTMLGLVAAGLVVHLKLDERARRAGRVKTDAVLVVSGSERDVRFTTTAGAVVSVREPTRVNPGTQRDGQTIPILYRPDRPTDVIISESTVARDITLWIVAAKLLVGGIVFFTVGIRRLRSLRRVGL